jgi:hypothetical protein
MNFFGEAAHNCLLNLDSVEPSQLIIGAGDARQRRGGVRAITFRTHLFWLSKLSLSSAQVWSVIFQRREVAFAVRHLLAASSPHRFCVTAMFQRLDVFVLGDVESRSTLEKYSDLFAHPDILLSKYIRMFVSDRTVISRRKSWRLCVLSCAWVVMCSRRWLPPSPSSPPSYVSPSTHLTSPPLPPHYRYTHWLSSRIENRSIWAKSWSAEAEMQWWDLGGGVERRKNTWTWKGSCGGHRPGSSSQSFNVPGMRIKKRSCGPPKKT